MVHLDQSEQNKGTPPSKMLEFVYLSWKLLRTVISIFLVWVQAAIANNSSQLCRKECLCVGGKCFCVGYLLLNICTEDGTGYLVGTNNPEQGLFKWLKSTLLWCQFITTTTQDQSESSTKYEVEFVLTWIKHTEDKGWGRDTVTFLPQINPPFYNLT